MPSGEGPVGPVGLEVGLLDQVLGVGPVARHAERRRVQARHELHGDVGEGRLISHGSTLPTRRYGLRRDAPPPRRSGIDLMDGAFYGREPHDAYAWMRAHAPVYYDEANDLWAAASYAAVKAASVDTESFSNAQGIRPKYPPLPMMIDFDAPEHVRRRRLVSEGFTPKRVRAMEDTAPRGLRRHPRPGVREGQLRLRGRHRGAAAHRGHRRHARRRAGRPGRAARVVRRHAQVAGLARPRRHGGRHAGLRRVHRATSTRSWPTARRAAAPTTSSACCATPRSTATRSTTTRSSTRPCSSSSAATRRRATSSAAAWRSCWPTPTSWPRLAADPDGPAARRGRGDAALGVAHQEHGPHRHPRRRAGRRAPSGGPGAPPPLPVGQPRRGGLRRARTPSTSRAAPTRTWPSASAPTSAWATSWPAWSSRSCSSACWPACPTCTWPSSAATLPRRQANFISGFEEMPVEFTPSAPLGAGPLMAGRGAGRHRRPRPSWSPAAAAASGWARPSAWPPTARTSPSAGAPSRSWPTPRRGSAPAATGGATARHVVADVTVEEQVRRGGGRHHRGDRPHRRPLRLRRRVDRTSAPSSRPTWTRCGPRSTSTSWARSSA